MPVRVRPVVLFLGGVCFRSKAWAISAAAAAYLVLIILRLAWVIEPGPLFDAVMMWSLWVVLIGGMAAATEEFGNVSVQAYDLPDLAFKRQEADERVVGQIVLRAMRGKVSGVDRDAVKVLVATWMTLQKAKPDWGLEAADREAATDHAKEAAETLWVQLEALLADEIARERAARATVKAEILARRAQARDEFVSSIDQAVQAATPTPHDQP